MNRFPFLGDRRVLAIAHRGGTIRHPENTLAAFQDAIDRGYRYIETDVHASADGQLYAFHDDDLERVVGRPALLRELNAVEIDAIRFGDGHRVPRLDEVLTTWPTLNVNIDPKADAAVQPLVEAVRRHGAVDRVCVGSFSDRRIAYCRREIGPDLCTSMGPFEVARLIARTRGLPTRPFESPCAQVPISFGLIGGLRVDVTTAAFISTAHELGIDVHVWTIDDEPTMTHLIEIGVDGILTDRPDVLRSVLIDNACWEAPDVQHA